MLVPIGKHLVNTDVITMVRELANPIASRYERGVYATHVVSIREDVKTEFVNDMFVQEKDLEELFLHVEANMLSAKAFIGVEAKETKEGKQRGKRR